MMRPTTLLAALLAVGFVHAEQAPETLVQGNRSAAAEWVAQTGLRGGILFLPQVTTSDAAVALAQDSPFIVYAQTASESVLGQMRDRASATGVLAKKLYTGLGSAGYLPLAPQSAAIVLVTGATEADLTDANLEAWLTALAPERGVLIIGSKGVNAPELAAIGKRLAARPGVFLRESPDKTLLLAGKRAVEGTDVWTHKFHDPANTRTSSDRTLKPPFLPAWYALPTSLGFWGDTMVADHGRAYHVWANRQHVNSVSLRCHELRSGQLLWERPFAWDKPRDNNSAGYYPGRSCMAVAGDTLALIDGPDIVFLDGETGHEKTRVAGPRPDGQIKWLACADEMLAVLSGSPDTFATTTKQQISKNPHGRHLAVYTLAGNKLLWSKAEEGDIDEREIAILDGRLYYHVHGEDATRQGKESKPHILFAKPQKGIKVACRELKTGKTLWENRDEKTLAALNEPTERNLHDLLISLRGLAATPQVLYFSTALSKRTVALGTEDGRLLWSEDTSTNRGRSAPDILWGDKVIRRGAVGEGLYSLLTNQKVGPARLSGAGCGPSFMVGDKMFGAFGGVYNPEDGSVVRAYDLKSPCDLGVIVSSGVALSPASSCTCATEIHGFRAFTSEQMASPSEKAAEKRLTQGPAFGRPMEADKDLSTQWPAFRHDTRRSGATAARIPETAPTQRWRWSPTVANPVVDPQPTWNMRFLELPEHLPTQPVTVDGTVYFADGQGIVRALDLKTGAERWKHNMGSKVVVSPQYHRGRLLLGTADGVAYCLDAADGALAWSYRMPERQRLILWYGHLASTWPILGGLVCEEGVAYALAGFQGGHDVFAAALDIATGNELWKGRFCDDNLGLAGMPALDRERVWFHPGGGTPAALDRRTGKLIRAENSKLPSANHAGGWTLGRDVAVLPNRDIIYGGKRVYDDFSSWAQPGKTLSYFLCKSDFEVSNTPLRNIGADLIEGSMTPPVFDSEMIVLARTFVGHKQTPQMQAWPTADITGRLAALPDGVSRTPSVDKRMPYSYGTLLPKGGGLPEGGIWKQAPSVPAYAMALCANAVLVVHPRDSKPSTVKDWNLTALRREDGQALWSIELPGRLAWDGLSVAADGSILLAYWDGSVSSQHAP